MVDQKPVMLEESCLELRINLADPADRERWSRYFEVTEVELRHAVRAVGTNGDEVRRFLGRQRSLFF